MVDCPRDDIRDLLPDLVHDQLEPEARVRVEQHLADCAECAAELGLLRALRATGFATPEVDADRIAAAVRAAALEATPGGIGEENVVPIPTALPRQRATDRASRPARRPAFHVWRIAAAIALMAAGAGGYALTRGGAPSLERAQESVAAGVASAPLAPATAKAGAPGGTPATAAGRSLAADAAAEPLANNSAPLILGDVVNELSESDMQTLLQSVDDLEAMPDLEPRPLPLLSRVVEGAL